MTLDIASTAFLAQSALSGAPSLHEVSPEEARVMYTGMAALSHEGPAMANIEEVSIPTTDGDAIRAHVLTPHGTPKSVLVYYHGGGWVIGSIDDYLTVGRHLAARCQSVVVLAGYRLAPEHRYPTAPNDCWDALNWVDKHMDKLAGRLSLPAIALAGIWPLSLHNALNRKVGLPCPCRYWCIRLPMPRWIRQASPIRRIN